MEVLHGFASENVQSPTNSEAAPLLSFHVKSLFVAAVAWISLLQQHESPNSAPRQKITRSTNYSCELLNRLALRGRCSQLERIPLNHSLYEFSVQVAPVPVSMYSRHCSPRALNWLGDCAACHELQVPPCNYCCTSTLHSRKLVHPVCI